MKKISTMLTSIAFFFSGYTQQLKESDIPTTVKSTFASMYPGVSNVKWVKEDDKYEAEFKQNKKGVSVLLDAAGKIEQTETEITLSTLPTAVTDYVSKNLNGKKIKEASKMVDSAGIVTYEAEVGGIDYLFDMNGNFIKTEIKEPEEDEEAR